MRKLYLWFVIASMAFVLTSCATAKLKKKLPQDIKAWYDLHSMLMTTKVPKWIFDGNKSENYCFLRIPEKAQRAYIRMFWKVRTEGLAEEFYSRYYSANRLFCSEGRIGWRTDRGYVMMTCGFPQYQWRMTVSELYFRWSSNPMNRDKAFTTPDHDTDGTVYIIWEYFYRRNLVKLVFKYRRGSYDLGYDNLISTGYRLELERYNRKVFAPTEYGWDLVGGRVLDWVKEHDSKIP